MLQKSLTTRLLASTVLISSLVLADSSEKLQLNISDTITVSGISSGGYMANQYHIAHSARVKGAGIIAAGPYYCAEGSLMTAMQQCLTNGSALDGLDLSAAINRASETAAIDAPDNLKSDRVWLLHGNLDKRVGKAVTAGLYRQYQTVVNHSDIRYLNDKPFNHVLPTRDFGIDCQKTALPFIAKCGYDAAGAMLSWLYPDITPVGGSGGTLHQISQPQKVDEKPTGLATTGYLYVPEQCASGASCQLHVSFHGCQQNEATIGKDYVEKGGFNGAAEQRSLVVLYPQIASGNPLNPLACWDWWGYTSDDYHTQNGPQIKAISQLTKHITQGNLTSLITQKNSGVMQ